MKTFLSRGVLALAAVLLAMGVRCWAQESQAKPEASKAAVARGGPDPMVMTLRDCVTYALENNLDIAISRIAPQIRTHEIVGAKSTFDPTFFANATYARRTSESISRQQVVGGQFQQVPKSDVKSSTYSTGLRQKLITGATAELAATQTRSDNRAYHGSRTILNPSYDTDLKLSITQPLLRDAWPTYNRSDIRIRNNNRAISQYQFRTTVINTIGTVQTRYWNLVRALEDLRVRQQSLIRAEKFLESTRVRYNAGTVAKTDVTEAEAEVAARVEGVIRAQSTVKTREDELKRVMNLADGQLLSDISITPADKPSFEVKVVDRDECIVRAMQNRPDLLELKLAIENQQIQVDMARNQLLPKLDAVGSYNWNALGRGPRNSVSKLGEPEWIDPDFNDKSIGLTLEIPIGNQRAKSNHNVARLEVTDATLRLNNRELQVNVEVRDAVRQIETNTERVKATQKARELAAERLSAEEKKLDAGKSTVLEVLRAQESLA
ncbi:MAG: TolC family protein, partial [Planctomycetes bacterium]|nr:TolC family protein [Planctomycetota bacterium]